MELLEIWRYPVKSLGGERLEHAELTPLGIDGDRRWGVRDDATGNILTGRREPGLLMLSAVHQGPGERPLVTSASGDKLDTDADLSDHLGRPVTLLAAGDEGGTYEVPLDPGVEEDWASWQGPGLAWHDSPKSRVSLVGTDTLRSWDIRRFRTNLVLRGGGEDSLVGSRMQLGGATFDVTKPIDRCVMVTRPQPGGIERDLDVLKTINRERDGNLSVGALIVEPGPLAVGDTLTAVGS
ncbi:MAG: MOSC N-terminal beta barrel domain-containing protein [Actinomycetota bacterium]|nr:MOSC N-terminal beta barrel domain-containing protein [Actinomycetota bacterium]